MGGLTDEQLRFRFRENVNSIAWLVWHMARYDDLANGNLMQLMSIKSVEQRCHSGRNQEVTHARLVINHGLRAI